MLLKFVVGLILIFGGGCASPPRQEALTLAGAGEAAALSMQTELQRVSTSTLRQSEFDAFIRTVDVCAKGEKFCKPQPVSSALIDERSKLAALIDKRVDALKSLGKAYEALRLEAEYDARSDLEGAVGDLTSSVNAYSGALSIFAPAAAAFPVVNALAPRAGGLFAAHKQRERLRSASLVIGKATAAMSEALSNEVTVHESFAVSWALRESDLRLILVEQNLVSRADILAPLAEAVGPPLVSGGEATISNSALLRTGVEAIVIAQSYRRQAAASAAIRASASALSALSAAHAKFDTLKQSDFEIVFAALSELKGAADGLRDVAEK